MLEAQRASAAVATCSCSTATVYEARCRATGRMVAVKDIDKSRQRYVLTDDNMHLFSCTRRETGALSLRLHHVHLPLPPSLVSGLSLVMSTIDLSMPPSHGCPLIATCYCLLWRCWRVPRTFTL